MRISRWLENLLSIFMRDAALGVRYRPRRARRRRGSEDAARHRLRFEGLEERRVLAFAAPVNLPAGDNPQAIVSADFNNDTFPDLAVANHTGSTVSVLLNNPAAPGTFTAGPTSSTSGSPLSLAVGDFNDDGTMDLATANAYDVSVMLGNGNGSFGAPTSHSVVGNPSSVAVGDFNADGRLDLGVTSNYYIPGYYYCYFGCYWYPGYYEGYSNVLLGTADAAGKANGSFSAPISSWSGYGYHASSAVGNFIGDGALDFASVNFDLGTVSVQHGNGTGLLGGSFDYSAGVYPWSLTTDDVNGDTRADLVAANRYGNDVSVLLGIAGGFSAPQNYATGSEPTSVVIGDFNNDTHLDIATANALNSISVLPGRGDGTFAPPLTSPAGLSPAGIAAEDFDGDGWLDAATANSSGASASILLNDQSWPSVPPPPPPPASLSIGDASVVEGDSGTIEAVFTVTRSANLSGAVSVNYSTSNGGALAGSDYVGAAGTLTFADGVDSMQLAILVNGDLMDEFDQSFFVNLSANLGVVIGDGQGEGTIVDNDAPPSISITPKVSLKEGQNNRTTSFDFIVTLSAPSEKEVRVNFATANGTATTADNDYLSRAGTLTFAPGVTSQTISVTVKGDKRKEGTETFSVNLTSPLNATIAAGQGIGEILEDDAPGKGKP